MFIDIVRLADNLGVEFAFPTQTLHLHKEEPGPAASQYQVPRGANDEQAMRAGALAAKEIVRHQPCDLLFLPDGVIIRAAALTTRVAWLRQL